MATRAASAGATVTASDLSPVLVEAAKRQAAERGLAVDVGVADAEATTYPDASYDVVSSSVGVIFAPDHAAVAGELARVCRPGSRIGLTAWRSDMSVGVGAMFREMSAFAPPPPPDAGSPFRWGDEDYVRGLLGDAFELRFEEANSVQTGPSGREVWSLFTDLYGPSQTLADSLGPERRAELEARMVDFFEQFRDGDGIQQSRPYLLVLGTRRRE